MLVVLAAVLAVLGLSAWHSLQAARQSLESARSELASLENHPHDLLSAAGRARAALTLDRVADQVAAARSEVASPPALRLAAWVPVLHGQRQGMLQLVDDVSTTVTEGRTLLQRADRLVADSSATAVNLADLRALTSSVAAAHATLGGLVRPAGGLWGPLGAARRDFDGVDAKVVRQLGRADEILGYANVFLGGGGARTYLLAAENNAEMRDQGAVLSVAQLSTDGGHLRVGDTSDVGAYKLSQPVDYPIAPGTQEVFGSFQPTLLWQSANAPAGFPWSGGDLQAMYRQATGVQVDGVVALDVVTLSSLLALSGPVTVPGLAQPVDAHDVAGILLHQLYQGYPPSVAGQDLRHDEISAVARAVIDTMAHEHIDLAALASTLSADVAGRHLLVWDADPAHQATLRAFGADGSIDHTDPAGAFHVAVENATATKLDYYVRVDVQQQIVLTPLDDAVVTTTVTVVNTAPPGQPPSLALGPDKISSFVPGQYVAHVFCWGPRGARIPGAVPESGLQLSQANLSVLAGQQASVVFHADIPAGLVHGAVSLTWVPQPRLVPVRVVASLVAPGRTVTSPGTQQALLTRTRTLRWAVRAR